MSFRRRCCGRQTVGKLCVWPNSGNKPPRAAFSTSSGNCLGQHLGKLSPTFGGTQGPGCLLVSEPVSLSALRASSWSEGRHKMLSQKGTSAKCRLRLGTGHAPEGEPRASADCSGSQAQAFSVQPMVPGPKMHRLKSETAAKQMPLRPFETASISNAMLASPYLFCSCLKVCA